MAIHETPQSMLKESLKEKVIVAEYCVKYRKDKSWGQEQEGGSLGYIAAELLFSIADTIGTLYRGNNEFIVKVDDEDKRISGGDYRNLYILNSEYYDYQNIPDRYIKGLYDSYRSPLVHNSLMLQDRYIHTGEGEAYFYRLVRGKPFVYLTPFLELSKKAYEKVISNIDEIFSKSQLSKEFKFNK